ncbi:hypothetical protein METBIDRAFT_146572 [Metschnikowia bicuspidata var. bicuspidata NRRL YB-4993]|uniref:Uncharacterized protein n=1 Tax=Metschnikowia bicuspidata var. bicuspidata NRRL YB-4993 TaxID=869754 RepID=A0A1A0HDM8_9ASCO|nr:hypothetical protein METBIDRAFT_146572 [Metschnikowia bicuspidata var. bicuspidata NRRL YB-4993]OBA22121.1 hypothetical protein METBIDRAFT_146572 [Metschnikowia bicuspidata var. bicuspidata NRRL YB-4993]
MLVRCLHPRHVTRAVCGVLPANIGAGEGPGIGGSLLILAAFVFPCISPSLGVLYLNAFKIVALIGVLSKLCFSTRVVFIWVFFNLGVFLFASLLN